MRGQTAIVRLVVSLGVLANCLLWTGISLPAPAADVQPLPTVASVDLARYMGHWYEIASIPMFFERDCTANTTADYKLLPDGLVKVINSCQTAARKRISSEGRATVIDTTTHAKLKITFLNLLGWRFMAGGDYWITALAPDYSYAIVGHPSRKYGWILSRQPHLPKSILRYLINNLAEQGYDICRFLTMPQPGGFQHRQSLCELPR